MLLTPIQDFELQRYLGTWYEIARLPNSFERGLDNVTATYSLKDNGTVKVVNRGFKKGKESKAVGKAKFASSPDIGHLKVSFFGPFYSDYIIIDLDSTYSVAMVSGSSRKLLWILARTPSIDTTVTTRLIVKAQKLGFDTDKIIFVTQNKQTY